MLTTKNFLSREIHFKLINRVQDVIARPKSVSTYNLTEKNLKWLHKLYPDAYIHPELSAENNLCDLLVMDLAFLSAINLKKVLTHASHMIKDNGHIVLSTLDYRSKRLIKKYAGSLTNQVIIDNIAVVKILNSNPYLSFVFIQEPIMPLGKYNQWINCDIFFIAKTNQSGLKKELAEQLLPPLIREISFA